MTGGTIAHNRIMRRLHRLLEQHLDGTPGEPFGPDVKIFAAGWVRYPDPVVSCTAQPELRAGIAVRRCGSTRRHRRSSAT